MKLPHILLLNILFLLILSSCKKHSVEEITSPVFAGVYNDSMMFHEFNQPLQIQLLTDTLNNIQYGIDSIDIDLDGRFDIFISQRIYLDWSDDFNRSYLEKDDFPFIGLRLKNGFEVAYKNLSFPLGQGAFYSVDMVDTIHYQARLDKITEWHDSYMNSNAYIGYYNNFIWFWGAPPSSFWLLGNYGPWYRLSNKEMFIGIRKKSDTEYKPGWIKIKVFNYDKFEILSYAIEK